MEILVIAVGIILMLLVTQKWVIAIIGGVMGWITLNLLTGLLIGLVLYLILSEPKENNETVP